MSWIKHLLHKEQEAVTKGMIHYVQVSIVTQRYKYHIF